jgi:GNAT superfamily N-acetyltransferase
VALAGHRCLGSASLVACDMDIRPALTPWLSGVCVAPEHRRRGVGAPLVERVMQEARALGKPRLYLLHARFWRSVSQTWRCVAERTFYGEHGVPGLRASSVKTSRNLPRLRPANRFGHGDVLSDFLGSFRGDVFRLYHFRAASDH